MSKNFLQKLSKFFRFYFRLFLSYVSNTIFASGSLTLFFYYYWRISIKYDTNKSVLARNNAIEINETKLHILSSTLCNIFIYSQFELHNIFRISVYLHPCLMILSKIYTNIMDNGCSIWITSLYNISSIIRTSTDTYS